MRTHEPPKDCLTCGAELKGRMDKKFCDDYCRSAYNNKMGPRSSLYVRNVNSVLRRNRRILQNFLMQEEESVRVAKSHLQERGFNFNHFTGAYIHKKGVMYYFCYEFGYLLVENEWYYISRRKDISIKNPG